MSDLRKDPILDHWVIMAAGRAERPGAFIESPAFDPALSCPFCEGHERETPPEVLAFRDGRDPPGPDAAPQVAATKTTSVRDGPHWRVRVVPNKFPAIETCGQTQPFDAEADSATGPGLKNHAHSIDDDLHQRLEACGAHEVIVESPRHVASTSDLSVAELAEVFLAYQMRLAYWKGEPAAAYGQIFKNVGQAAGASLEHVHSQLLVVPRIPSVIAAEMTGATGYFQRHGVCPFCDMIRQERAAGERIVEETAHHLCFAPYAARLPFETWVLPKRHAGRYEETPVQQLTDLAGIMRSVIGRLEAAVGRCGYNYVVHTLPFHAASAHYHWHLEIVPAVAKTAGFELGSGWFINPVPPERAARLLRKA